MLGLAGINGNQIVLPKFLKDYMEDFGEGEADLLSFVLKYSKDRAISVNRVIEDYQNKELTLVYDQVDE